MSSDDALQALDDIEEWLVDQGATAIVKDLNEPIDAARLTALETKLGYAIPEELRAVYKRHDGQRSWSRLENSFFPYTMGGFCDFASAVKQTTWTRFIGPWFQPNVAYDPAWDSLERKRHPEEIVPRSWMHVDRRSTKDLLAIECSTAWLVFAWNELTAGVLHLRSGRVFEWEKESGIRFAADSFGAYLMKLADDVWNDAYRVVQDDGEDGPWIWDGVA
jgi:hypothetical protein